MDARKLALPLLAIAGGIVAGRVFGFARVARAGMTLLAAAEAWRRAAPSPPQVAHEARPRRTARAPARKKGASQRKKRTATARKAATANAATKPH